MIRGATRRLAVVITALVGIALILLPAPGDAFDVPASVAWAQQAAALPIGATVPRNPGIERMVLAMIPPFPSLAPVKSSSSIVAEHDLPITITGTDGVTLTPDEYDQFRQMLGTKRATAWEVGWLNFAVKGTGLLLVGCFWIILLVIMRHTFNRWWDRDIHKQTWPSTIVVTAMIVCTAWILQSVLQ